ncbi:peptidoglycan-binding protein [Kitasatospora sp. NPDC059747]|uniref:peptidoglycan-binding protein n=1 Tax=Kitasatospora sp. NPDC059747 TaxID=3346930 RepID=UPI003658E271
MTWPCTADQVLNTARSFLGTAEYPDGSNHNFITDDYGIGDGPWCAMAVWDEFNRNGVDLRQQLTKEWAWTPSAAMAGKSAGLWHDGPNGLTPGDIVFYKVPGGAAGFVNHVALYEGNGVSIDGNWGNRCQRVTHPTSIVVGYIRPPYSASNDGPPPFPGAGAFYIGAYGDYVTEMGEALVAKGYGSHYQVGPGPTFSEADRLNVQDFQHAQGWTGDDPGGDSDGYPGPETWRRLFS